MHCAPNFARIKVSLKTLDLVKCAVTAAQRGADSLSFVGSKIVLKNVLGMFICRDRLER